MTFLQLLQMVAVTAVTLGTLVTAHEFGHFWVARRCGVKVLRFSIGFGRPWLRWTDKRGTEFVLATIPLGGYVKMLDEREGEVPPELQGQSFNRKPVLSRIAILAAGAGFNFLLAFFVYWGVLFFVGSGGVAPVIDAVAAGSLAERAGVVAGQEIVAVDDVPTPTVLTLFEQLMGRVGESGVLKLSVKSPHSDVVYDSNVTLEHWLSGTDNPDMIEALGLTLFHPKAGMTIDSVDTDTPAARAGLQAGDHIVAADGVAFTDWDVWQKYVRARPQQEIAVTVERSGVPHVFKVVPARKVDEQGHAFGQLGVAVATKWPPEMLRMVHYGPLQAFGAAGTQTWSTAKMSLDSMKKMVLGMISPKNLSGPITIAKVATAQAKSGWVPYLEFLAFFSVSLGVLNLLPIPVLDGGHILFSLPELLIGRPLSEKIQIVGSQIGLVVIVGVMMLALYNDLMHL